MSQNAGQVWNQYSSAEPGRRAAGKECPIGSVLGGQAQGLGNQEAEQDRLGLEGMVCLETLPHLQQHQQCSWLKNPIPGISSCLLE